MYDRCFTQVLAETAQERHVSTTADLIELCSVSAGGGTLIGGLATGQPLRGAAIGAAAGAVGGWLYDRHEKSEGR